MEGQKVKCGLEFKGSSKSKSGAYQVKIGQL